MLQELKFVASSVARKDYVPDLTHFKIENGTVRGFNGMLALCSPIPFDITCNPKADTLLKAIKNCRDDEPITLAMTAAGRLAIKSGKFKAYIDCIEGETQHVQPEGERFDFDGESFLKAVKAVAPFVGDDASRPWVNGILFRGKSAYATNNVIVAEYWTGIDFPITVNFPLKAVKEVLRIDEAPEYAQSTMNSITIHYAGNRWIRTQMLPTDWPDLSKILDAPSVQTPINPEIFAGLEVIKPFVDKLGRVTFHEGNLCTSLVEGEGSRYEVEGLVDAGSYNHEMLSLLSGIATTIDFSLYPKPCVFFGDKLRGAIIGLRQT